MTVTEIEILEGLDFDPDVECDNPPCTNEAVLRLIMVCCGVVYLSCQPCYDESVETVMAMDGRFCFHCKVKFPDDCKLEDIYRVEPL